MNYLRDVGVLHNTPARKRSSFTKGLWIAKAFWYGINTDLLVTGVNTSQMNVKTAPRSYADYLKPEFKNKMAFHLGTNNPLIGMAEV